MEGFGQDAKGRRMEGFYARKWNQLYPNHPILCSAIWKLQFLQKGNASTRHYTDDIQTVLMLYTVHRSNARS